MNIFKRNGSKLPTKGMLTIRVVVGGYLVYLAYTLFTETDTSMSRWQIIAFSAFFVIVGAVIIGLTAYLYFNGMYEGGKWDIPEEEGETSEDGASVVDTEAVEVAPEQATEENTSEEKVTEEESAE